MILRSNVNVIGIRGLAGETMNSRKKMSNTVVADQCPLSKNWSACTFAIARPATLSVRAMPRHQIAFLCP
jgi:hypothetical protein